VATRVVATAVDTTPVVAAAAWVEADMVVPLVETEEVTSTTMATIITTTLALDMDQDMEVDPNGDKDLPSEELDPTEAVMAVAVAAVWAAVVVTTDDKST